MVTEPIPTTDPALSAVNYTPPSHVTSNSDVIAQADMAAIVKAAVDAALAQREAEAVAASQPKVLTPEEQARVHLDNRGYLLGQEERLQQIYWLLHVIAQKVGI